MSSDLVIITIIGAIIALIAFGFIHNTIERNKEIKRAQERRLKGQLAYLHDFKQSLPLGFLDKTIHTLINNCTLHILIELNQLQGKPEYKRQIDSINATAPDTGEASSFAILDSLEQIREAQKLVKMLDQLLNQLLAEKRITPAQQQQHMAQLIQLHNRAEIDQLLLSSDTAGQESKLKLQQHYARQAIDKIQSLQLADLYAAKIASLNELLSLTVAEVTEPNALEQGTESLDNMLTADGKKKQVYD